MMRFCQLCNNMLHPRENPTEKKLEYYCRQSDCHYVERNVQDRCVYANELVKDTQTRLEVVLSELNKDPTLQRSTTVSCDGCGHNEAVLFQAEQTTKSTALSLVYICCKCGHKWIE